MFTPPKDHPMIALLKEVKDSKIIVAQCCVCKKKFRLLHKWYELNEFFVDYIYFLNIPITHTYCDLCAKKNFNEIHELRQKIYQESTAT